MHTKEPWKVGEFGGIYQATGGACIVSALTPSGFLPNSIANERRIVACVNACAGISTDGLESAGVGGLRHIAEATFEQRMSRNEIEQQRDELMEALAPFAALLQDHNREGRADNPIFGINSATITRGDLRRAAAAIAKVTQS